MIYFLASCGFGLGLAVCDILESFTLALVVSLSFRDAT